MHAHYMVSPSRRLCMADAKPIAPIRIGGTDIHYAQGMRAGPWLFFTGHEASDFERGIAAAVVGKPGLPLNGQARHRREADYVLARLAKLIAAEGGDLRHIVHVDQYYPSARGESLSARTQGFAQGLRAAEHVRAHGGTAGGRRQH